MLYNTLFQEFSSTNFTDFLKDFEHTKFKIIHTASMIQCGFPGCPIMACKYIIYSRNQKLDLFDNKIIAVTVLTSIGILGSSSVAKFRLRYFILVF